MSSSPPPRPTTLTGNDNLFASVDMGTNAFKLLIVRIDPSTGRFLTLDRRRESVLLGLEATSTISHSSTLRATSALRKFQNILLSRRVPASHSRLVATSAVRESTNKSQFINSIHETLGLHVDVLSGSDEASLIYLGVLQFHSVHNNTVLTIDIGGGSTEFAIGHQGKILYSISLPLGHLTLTRRFPQVEYMREYIRNVMFETDLVSKVTEYNIEKVIGSSGTIRKIEKAVYKGFTRGLGDNVDEFRRDWSFDKEDLKRVVERLNNEERERGGKISRRKFFSRRSGFIMAGAVLLEEIFSCLGLEVMEVSEYALGEGVIAEMAKQVYEGYGTKSNAQWQSAVRCPQGLKVTR